MRPGNPVAACPAAHAHSRNREAPQPARPASRPRPSGEPGRSQGRRRPTVNSEAPASTSGGPVAAGSPRLGRADRFHDLARDRGRRPRNAGRVPRSCAGRCSGRRRSARRRHALRPAAASSSPRRRRSEPGSCGWAAGSALPAGPRCAAAPRRARPGVAPRSRTRSRTRRSPSRTSRSRCRGSAGRRSCCPRCAPCRRAVPGCGSCCSVTSAPISTRSVCSAQAPSIVQHS